MSKCHCGATRFPPEMHRFGCPYRNPGSMSQYTTPKFEDGTIGHTEREARRRLNDVKALQEQAQAMIDEAYAWVELHEEMKAVGAKVISELPPHRAQHWKTRLHKPPVMRF